jgi:hypothetical protein
LAFAWRRVREVSAELTGALRLALRLRQMAKRVTNDPGARSYRDTAMTPPTPRGVSLPVLPASKPAEVEKVAAAG